MDFSFKFDPEVIIGADTLSLAGTACSRHGERVMIAADHDLDTQVVNRLKDILEDSGVKAIVFDGVHEDSSADMADNIVELGRAAHCNAVIGIGGGKALLIARMAAIMAPSRITSFELLDGRKITEKFLPFIAVPTAGLDPFAFTEFFIAADPRDRIVKSVYSPHGLNAAVVIDSALFKFPSVSSVAMEIFNGFMAAIEAYCSSKANFLSDALLERALNFYAKLIKGGANGLNAVISADPNSGASTANNLLDTYAQACFLTSLGSAASSPGIGAALSYAITARFHDVKQQCAAALLPFITERLAAARPEKMSRVASFLGNTKAASVAEAANSASASILRSMEAFGIKPSLKEFNLPLDKLTAAADAARKLEFVSNSPWTVSEDDIFEILKKITA
ncbi:MAG: iron-containing alcohol dehydrogenase [Treponema sp.]|nr:iron-containing alcohol dehydrogenase [Treponema sp.]